MCKTHSIEGLFFMLGILGLLLLFIVYLEVVMTLILIVSNKIE